MQGPEMRAVLAIFICVWVVPLTLSKAVEHARGCVAANIGFGAMVAERELRVYEEVGFGIEI